MAFGGERDTVVHYRDQERVGNRPHALFKMRSFVFAPRIERLTLLPSSVPRAIG